MTLSLIHSIIEIELQFYDLLSRYRVKVPHFHPSVAVLTVYCCVTQSSLIYLPKFFNIVLNPKSSISYDLLTFLDKWLISMCNHVSNFHIWDLMGPFL